MSIEPFNLSEHDSVDAQLEKFSSKRTQVAILFYSDQALHPEEAINETMRFLVGISDAARMEESKVSLLVTIDDEPVVAEVKLKPPQLISKALN